MTKSRIPHVHSDEDTRVITFWIDESEYIETPTEKLPVLAWLSKEQERLRKDNIRSDIQKKTKNGRILYRLVREELGEEYA